MSDQTSQQQQQQQQQQAESSASVYARASTEVSAARASSAPAPPRRVPRNPPPPAPPGSCSLFAITQFECMATDRVTCWPIERIFRQCAGGPAMEVTNKLVHTGNDGKDGSSVVVPLVDPHFIAQPPKGDTWSDFN